LAKRKKGNSENGGQPKAISLGLCKKKNGGVSKANNWSKGAWIWLREKKDRAEEQKSVRSEKGKKNF